MGTATRCSSTPRTPGVFSAAIRNACLSASDRSSEHQICTILSRTMMSAAQTRAHSCACSSARSLWRIVRSSRSVSVGFGRGLAFRRHQGAHQVCPADDPDDFPVANHGNSLDPFGLKQVGDLIELGRLGDRDHVVLHDVSDRTTMSLDVIAGEVALARKRVEPPRASPLSPSLGSGLGAM